MVFCFMLEVMRCIEITGQPIRNKQCRINRITNAMINDYPPTFFCPRSKGTRRARSLPWGITGSSAESDRL